MWIVRSAVIAAVVAAGVLAWAPSAAAEPCPVLTTVPGDQLSCADLRGVDLSQDDLAGADLHGSDLTGADLLQADLRGANLAGAKLTGARLGQADLNDADLTGADLRGADLTQADLTGADLRGADLTGADFTQAQVDDIDLRGAELRDVSRLGVSDASGVQFDATSLDDHPQVAQFLFWPAAAVVLMWWRRRIGLLVRHRGPVPVVLAAGMGIASLVLGVYLFAVGISRGFAHIVGLNWLWAVEPGPLAAFAAEPGRQLLVGAAGIVLGGLLLLLVRGRRKVTGRAADTGQVVLGEPTLGALYPTVGPRVRRVARVLALLGVADVVAVIALWWFDGLPASGPWQAGSVLGHLVVVAVATFFLLQITWDSPLDNDVEALSGAVLAGSGRNPYVWLSGTSRKQRVASRVLPWSALEHVHLIRLHGAPEPKAAMVTVHAPGGSRTEYSTEMAVTPAQVSALRAVLPEKMITEHVRVPSSG